MEQEPTSPAELQGADEHQRLLIVNADDFGITAGVCRGVLRAHQQGVVTSTSALVLGPAFPHHAAALRDAGIAVGAHLTTVGEDRPLLSAREIPSLVDREGRFPRTWQTFTSRAAKGRVDTDDLRREFGAQIELMSHHRLRLTHLDSHQNLHLWPQVATVLLEIAATYRIRAIRLTRTARWSPVSVGVRALSATLRVRARRAGLVYPVASSGLDEAGALDRGGFLLAIGRLGASGAHTAELVTHLAEDPDPDRHRYATDYRWADELAAACDPQVRRAIDQAGFRLGSYADLTTRTGPA